MSRPLFRGQVKIINSITRLVKEDGELFRLSIEDDEHELTTARVLHEVCINHQLANHLAESILPLVKEEKMYVDIEFNREGENPKEVLVTGKKRKVRPDIIIHNRKSGDAKFNLLVVECKKCDAGKEQIGLDCVKIEGMMKDPKFDYKFGLQVLYGNSNANGKFFYKEDQMVKIDELSFDL